VLYGVSTISPHANGFTAIRKLASTLPKGYFTELPSGRTFGEAVLEPTPGYARIVNDVLSAGVPVHYLQPITGHGFKKIARPKRDLTYRITSLPEMPEVFKFIQEHAHISDKEMLETYNCGLGFVIYAPKDSEGTILSVAKKLGGNVSRIGKVEEGPRQVIVQPRNVVFSTNDITQ